MTDLLPCPFCGGEPSKIASHCSVEAVWQIRCEHDECLGPHTTAGTEQDAIVQWNTRAHLPAQPQRAPGTPADAVIAQIEERFPNWQSFRDLVDCIDCTLHDLRRGA